MDAAEREGRTGPLLPDVGVIALARDGWTDQWMVRHHVMARLARYFRVVWMVPPLHWRNARPGSGELLPGDASPVPGLTVRPAEWWLPTFYRPASLGRWTARTRLERARRGLLGEGCRRVVLYAWHFDFEPLTSAIESDLTCYHLEDEYAFSPRDNLAELRMLQRAELRMLQRVDHVFILSPALLDKKGAINANTSYVPGGVDYDLYARAYPEPEDLRLVPHPRIGYTGHLKKQLDWPLLADLSVRHPEWSFVFVGDPVTSHREVLPFIREMAARRNVFFCGAKPCVELARYPQHFDVSIMPYLQNDYTRYIYPLKLHEYLAAGRPIVSTRIRSLLEFEDVVSLVESPADWSGALRHALGEPDAPEARRERQQVAHRYDWDEVVLSIARTVARRLGGDVLARLDEVVLQPSAHRQAAPRAASGGTSLGSRTA